ncbi:hypothetical protein K8I85_18195 [bacterium]|nr:hypothetical protein [bacterium]
MTDSKRERAFEAYFALGPKRSLAKVARQLDVPDSTIKRWSRVNDWQTRVADRDHDIARVAAGKSVQAGVDASVRNRQIVQMALVQAARQIAEGKVRCTVSDLDRLIRLEAFLDGHADSRQEIIARDLAGKSTTELRILLRRELEVLHDLTDTDGAEVDPDDPEMDPELLEMDPGGPPLEAPPVDQS